MPLNILYELYDTFPAGKGSSRRTSELLNPDNHELHINYTLVCKYKEMKREFKFPFEVHRIRLSLDETTYDPIEEGLLYRKEFNEMNLQKYDIIHARSPWAGVIIANKRDQYGFKYIYEWNGLPSMELAYTNPKYARSNNKSLRKLAQNELFCALKADLIIVVTEIAKEYLIRKGIKAEKIRILRNGVNPSVFYPKVVSKERRIELYDHELHPFNGDEIILGYIGALQPWQGLISLIQGLEAIIDAFPHLKLVVAGKGKHSWRKYLRNVVKEKGIREHLVLLKETKDLKNIPELINSFDFCIAPFERTGRNTEMGANPIKLYEYAACGKNIIVTDLPISREIFKEGEVFFIPTPEDEEFITSVIHAIQSGENRGNLAMKSIQKETWKQRGKQLDAIYTELANN
ncbi:MAG: glycosyltransferase family 4 protein [Candidatus Heimdallarchaeota archaeon]|nr:glycosyltransferase family 4 protein [Candidatus Heimdallarchaeota archaeon]